MIEPRHGLTKPRTVWSILWEMEGWLIVIAAVVVLFLTGASVRSHHRANLLESDGVWGDALITSLSQRRDNGRTKYKVRIRYKVDGQFYVNSRSVSHQFYTSNREGAKIPVHYWSEGPDIVEVYEGQVRRAAKSSQTIALIAGAVMLGLIWFKGNGMIRMVKARRHGVRTAATILSVKEGRRKGKPTGRGHVLFRTMEAIEGKSLQRDIDTLNALGVGTEIVVFVWKGKAYWEGDVGPRSKVPSRLPKVPVPPHE